MSGTGRTGSTGGAPERIVVMGVSGAGKSLIGAELAARLGYRFEDADDLHPLANVTKMRSGVPLTDVDRGPWLDAVATALAAAEGGIVMACSALRVAYRDRIRAGVPEVFFVELQGSEALLHERMAARAGHFMPVALLRSQLATLESLGADERGAIVPIDGPPEVVLDRTLAALG